MTTQPTEQGDEATAEERTIPRLLTDAYLNNPTAHTFLSLYVHGHIGYTRALEKAVAALAQINAMQSQQILHMEERRTDVVYLVRLPLDNSPQSMVE